MPKVIGKIEEFTIQSQNPLKPIQRREQGAGETRSADISSQKLAEQSQTSYNGKLPVETAVKQTSRSDLGSSLEQENTQETKTKPGPFKQEKARRSYWQLGPLLVGRASLSKVVNFPLC